MDEKKGNWYFVKIDYGEILDIIDFDSKSILQESCKEQNVSFKYICDDLIIFDCQTAIDEQPFRESVNNQLAILLEEQLIAEYSKVDQCIELPLSFADQNLIKKIKGEHPDLHMEYNSIENQLALTGELNEEIISSIIDQLSLSIRESNGVYLTEISIETDLLPEITISLACNKVSKEEIEKVLSSNELIMILEVEEENTLVEEIDYKLYTDSYLIHNIRKKNIIICNYSTTTVGFFILGHMNVGSRTEITLKAFDYQIIEELMTYFKESLDITFVKDNLSWKMLSSRKVSKGYRNTDQHIIENSLMGQFLEKSKKDYFRNHMQFILGKLLDKGYLDANEFLENTIVNGKGKETTIAGEPGLRTFFIEYDRYKDTQTDKYKSLWIEPSSGRLFGQKKDKGDPKVIEIIDGKSKIDKIHAPANNLLYYIRSFWHQQFVHDLLVEIQSELESEDANFRIVNIEVDLQFDFLNDLPEKSSKDIDVLIEVKNVVDDTRFIIAIEAKRNADEYKNELKVIPKKIELGYANIFAGFILVAYFDNLADHLPLRDLENQKLVWEQDGQAKLSKPFLLCVSSSYVELKKEVAEAIKRIGEVH